MKSLRFSGILAVAMAILAPWGAHSAQARLLTDAERACVFKQPMSFGASITAATPTLLPLYKKAVNALAIYRKRRFLLPDFGQSPATLLNFYYARIPLYTSTPNLAPMFVKEQEDLGSSQIQEMLEGKYRETFQRSSLVIGVDAFYWDAIWENCGTGAMFTAEEAIDRLTNEARKTKKTLILGNVPDENPDNVLIDSEALGINGLWYRPNPVCVERINRKLQESCHTRDNCYIIDFFSMVAELNAGRTLKLNDGSSFDLLSMRPDGVHLSVYGSRFVYEQMVKLLEENPPVCE